MAIPLDKSVICPVLIGRSSALRTVQLAFDQTDSGKGQALLISGEAGIGKSRLVAAAKTEAVQRDWLILEGNCFQPDTTYPYAPVVDLLRPYFAVDHLEADTPHWASIARELSRFLPELIPLSAPPELSSIPEADQNKRRLFAALLQVFSYFAAQHFLLVIVEDLHWSDDTSLEFLNQLARWSKTHPVLMLLTYRSDEIRPSLRHWLAQLDREHLVQELSLTRLTRFEVDEMLKAIFELRRPMRSEFLDAIYRLTEGNPFFIEEILKSLMVAGGIFYSDDSWDRKALPELHIPRSVHDAIQQQATHLSATAQQIIVLAAVAGRRFDFALLQMLTKHDEAQLLSAIKELVAAQLVIEESAERFAFRHALTREAVYANLLIRERVVLHERVAEALERLYGDSLDDSHITEFAYHFYEAGQWERAFQYCWRAGELACQLYALPSAVEQFTHALDAAKHLEIPTPLSLFRARGLVYEAQGDFEPARSDHELVLQKAQAVGDRQAEWQALLDLGTLWASRDYEQTGVYYRQALALAREIEASSLVARSLNRLGNWYMNAEQPMEAQVYHREALSLFQELGDRSGLAETLDLLGIANYDSCDLIQGAHYLEQAATLFRDLQDRAGLSSSLTILLLCRSETYETMTMIPAKTSFAQVAYEGELALQIARDIGWRSQEAYAGIQIGTCLGLQGDYKRAFEMAQTGLDIAEEIEHKQWMTSAHRALGSFYSDILLFPLAQQHLNLALGLAREIGSSLWTSITSAALASLAVAQGDFGKAAALIETLLKTKTADQGVFGARRARMAGLAQAELALATGGAELALQTVDQLTETAQNGTSESRIPFLLRLRGEALIQLQQWDAAQASLAAASAEAAERRLRPLLWRIQVAFSKLYQAQMRWEEAEDARLAAQQIVESLAAGILNDSVRTEFLHQASTFMPGVRSSSPRQAAQRQLSGLTRREREVAIQISRGQSNRAIADLLFISERTVESHISSMLSKLGFSSRAQIAVWAVEKGLSGDSTH